MKAKFSYSSCFMFLKFFILHCS